MGFVASLWSLGVPGIALLLVTRAVVAQDLSPAEAAFQQGRTLLASKRYAEACPKFAESHQQEPAPGTLLALAYCQELAGQLASAWSSYVAASELARRSGNAEREQVAAARASALEDRLSTLSFVVPEEVARLPGFRLMRDGEALEPSRWPVPTAVDGGAHLIEATALDRKPWRVALTVGIERDKTRVVVPMLETEPAPSELAEPKSGAALARIPLHSGGPAAAPAQPAGSYDRRDSRPQGRAPLLKTASLALAAGAVGSLTVATVFAFIADGKHDASNSDGHCDRTGCDPRGLELRREALAAARVATVAALIGAGLGLGSLTLYVLPGATSEAAGAAGKGFASRSLTSAQVTVSGAF